PPCTVAGRTIDRAGAQTVPRSADADPRLAAGTRPVHPADRAEYARGLCRVRQRGGDEIRPDHLPRRAGRSGRPCAADGAVLMHPGTLAALLDRTVEAHGAQPAVTDATGTLDWPSFAARVAGYAGLLRGQGIAPGDRVALWLPNSADYLALIFACARIGAVAVHVNTRFRVEELG